MDDLEVRIALFQETSIWVTFILFMVIHQKKIWESLNIIESWDQTFPKIWIKQTGTPGTPQFSGYGSLVFMMFGEAVQPWKSPWKIHPPEKNHPPIHPDPWQVAAICRVMRIKPGFSLARSCQTPSRPKKSIFGRLDLTRIRSTLDLAHGEHHETYPSRQHLCQHGVHLETIQRTININIISAKSIRYKQN